MIRRTFVSKELVFFTRDRAEMAMKTKNEQPVTFASDGYFPAY